MQKKRFFLFFLALFIFSATINLTMKPYLHGDQNLLHLDSDEQEYFLLSGKILDGTYEFPSRRTLGHVLIVTSIRLLTGDNLAALLLIIACFSSLTSPLVYAVTWTALRSEGVAKLAYMWTGYPYLKTNTFRERSLPSFSSCSAYYR